MVSVQRLTKSFGTNKAVDEVSFEIKKGEVFGLLGENGAGKTTTLRMLATMLKPTSGTAMINGMDINKDPQAVRFQIGILFGGETGLYDRLTVYENIAYFAELNDMERGRIKARIAEMARTFGMEEFMNKRAGKLSKGMKQKAAFGRAIVHDPQIMFFDEPTSGLDVSAARNVHDFIMDCKKAGKTILFSSHTMSEVEKLCDRIGIIHKGKLVDTGTIDELKAKYNNSSLEEIFIHLVGGGKFTC
ncbi:ABC transporter ATP-binding protein [Pseudobacteroides cellulosolvens]|nr:ATP-binding cassette domain-containing protein [Pseudobacteroides cellulosolvens]